MMRVRFAAILRASIRTVSGCTPHTARTFSGVYRALSMSRSNAKTGRTLEKTFRSGERVEPAYVEKKKMQFLYRQGSEIVLMDLDTYEQDQVAEASIGEQAKYLKEEMEVTCLVAGGDTLGYEVPNFVELEVTETDPGYRGDTVSGSSTKPAKVETGATVNVPFHINVGDMIKIDTRTDEYLERVKK